MFSKASDEWSTPYDFFAALDAEFRFGLDAAATNANSQCLEYLGPDHIRDRRRDALAVNWDRFGPQPIWLNPPYSKCREFIIKASGSAAEGCTVVCLVPSRTDTRWFHDCVWDASKGRTRPGVELRFIKGRLKFGGCDNSAPFPSAVIIFRPVVA
jgi:phage N-6-adenine-methyltransferase